MKKTSLYLFIAFLTIILVTFLVISLTKPKNPNSTFLNTIPLLNQNATLAPTSTTNNFQSTNTPPQTNMDNVQNKVDSNLSSVEKEKILSILPTRIDDFKTSTALVTTINLYSLPTDPLESVRLEIYNLNFNNSLLTSTDAIAFKDSFIEIKKILLVRKVNLKNLQIIYGNRQYIQDTATYWVNSFKLLD